MDMHNVCCQSIIWQGLILNRNRNRSQQIRWRLRCPRPKTDVEFMNRIGYKICSNELHL